MIKHQHIPVSVLMPAFNAGKYIGGAIKSILNQSFRHFELIIIDDGSTDNTWKTIQSFAKKDPRIITLKNNQNMKIVETLNEGLTLARGEYILRMDADDWSYPDRIEKQLSYMKSHPDLVISGGVMEICDNDLKVIAMRKYKTDDESLRRLIMRYSPFSHPTVIFKTRAAKKVGGYKTLYSEDIEFYFKIGQFGKFGNLTDTLIKYRGSVGSSMTNTKLRITEINTIKHRLYAARNLNYKFSLIDGVYNLLQFVSVFIIPANWKIFLFNRFRNNKVES